MKKSGKVEIELLNIQVGCILRLARLKKGISQLELGLMIDSNPTMIGRIERFESVSGWDKIFLISRQLDVDFNSLFILRKKESLLNTVEESFRLEEKLTKEKEDYYKSLKELIESKFKLFNK